MSDIVIKSTPKAEMKVSIKVDSGSLPNGGAPGDVLTKTESGTEWQKPTGGEGTVKTVNGIGPDENGNVELPAVEIPEVDLSGVVKSVNGTAPDENGNVAIEIPTPDISGMVKSVNGVMPDENGNVTIEVSSDISIDDSEVLDILIELDALPAVTDADGAIYTDENGSILMM
jgi:hypothetical protein